MSLTNFDLHRLCKRMDLPIVGVFSKDELEPIPHQIGTYLLTKQELILFVLKLFVMKIETTIKVRKTKRKYVKQYTLIVSGLTCLLKLRII